MCIPGKIRQSFCSSEKCTDDRNRSRLNLEARGDAVDN